MKKVETTGTFLKGIREENGETMQQVAKRISATSSRITGYEAGHRKFSEKVQKIIAKAYQLTDRQKQQLSELANSVNKETKHSARAQSQTEYEVFYSLMLLPKEIRDRVIRAVRAYESSRNEC